MVTYVFRQEDLPKLNLQVNKGTHFQTWKKQWEAYFGLSGLDAQEDAKQDQVLILCLSWETLMIVEKLELSDEQCKKTKEIIVAIEDYNMSKGKSTSP